MSGRSRLATRVRRLRRSVPGAPEVPPTAPGAPLNQRSRYEYGTPYRSGFVLSLRAAAVGSACVQSGDQATRRLVVGGAIERCSANSSFAADTPDTVAGMTVGCGLSRSTTTTVGVSSLPPLRRRQIAAASESRQMLTHLTRTPCRAVSRLRRAEYAHPGRHRTTTSGRVNAVSPISVCRPGRSGDSHADTPSTARMPINTTSPCWAPPVDNPTTATSSSPSTKTRDAVSHLPPERRARSSGGVSNMDPRLNRASGRIRIPAKIVTLL